MDLKNGVFHGRPAYWLAILVLLAGIEAEEGDDGHHGDSQTVVPERSGEGAGCGVDAALMGVGRAHV